MFDYNLYENPNSPFYFLREFDPTPYPGETFVKLEYPLVSIDTKSYYYISNYGRVLSTANEKPKIMKHSTDTKGYPIVVLSRGNRKCNAYRIHRFKQNELFI